MATKASSSVKPKGKMSAYTFFVQACRDEHRRQYPLRTIDLGTFSKQCASRWKDLSDSEKRRFVDLSAKDKQRFDREMAKYVPPVGTERKKRQKDPNAPRRPMSAFFHFCAEERPKVRAQQPDISVGDIAKELGARWAALGDAAKTKYQDLNQRDRDRYEREKRAYDGGHQSKKSVKGRKRSRSRSRAASSHRSSHASNASD